MMLELVLKHQPHLLVFCLTSDIKWQPFMSLVKYPYAGKNCVSPILLTGLDMMHIMA